MHNSPRKEELKSAVLYQKSTTVSITGGEAFKIIKYYYLANIFVQILCKALNNVKDLIYFLYKLLE